MSDVNPVMDAASLYDEGGIAETVAGDVLAGALNHHTRRAVEKGLYPPIFYAVLHWFPILGTTLTLSMISDRPPAKALLDQRLGKRAMLVAFVIEVFYLWVIVLFLFPPFIVVELAIKGWLSKVFYEVVAETRR